MSGKRMAIVYLHGKGGCAAEAAFYQPLFPNADVIGFDYKAETPWEAAAEFPAYFAGIAARYDEVRVIGNSIGAFFLMSAGVSVRLRAAYFVSPVVDMERLIADMMRWSGVTEAELREKGEIPTEFGETLSWDYLTHVRAHPLKWDVPTHILYGENDALTSFETVSAFARRTGAAVTVMKGGEHWFHTEEQLRFLAQWIGSL